MPRKNVEEKPPTRAVPDAADLTTQVSAALGRAVAAIEKIEAGLGARRFYRVLLTGDDAPRSVVARVDAPEDPRLRPKGVPPEPPLEPVRALLESAGLPVPACLHRAEGWMLLEDVGDTSLEVASSGLPGAEVESLYREACELVPRLQAVGPAPEVANFERQLDAALFSYKAEQVVEWTLPWAGLRRPEAAGEDAAVREGFAAIAEIAADAPQRLSHRDFKAANLHLHPRNEAGTRLVMIDLQGAFLAPPEYDLVCLLRDSHVELAEPFVTRLLESVRPRLPDAPSLEAFALRFDLLTLTRNGKDLSRYLYAAKTRGDDRYLALVPRAVRTLRDAAERCTSVSPAIDRLAEVFLSLPLPPPLPEDRCEQ